MPSASQSPQEHHPAESGDWWPDHRSPAVVATTDDGLLMSTLLELLANQKLTSITLEKGGFTSFIRIYIYISLQAC